MPKDKDPAEGLEPDVTEITDPAAREAEQLQYYGGDPIDGNQILRLVTVERQPPRHRVFAIEHALGRFIIAPSLTAARISGHAWTSSTVNPLVRAEP